MKDYTIVLHVHHGLALAFLALAVIGFIYVLGVHHGRNQ